MSGLSVAPRAESLLRDALDGHRGQHGWPVHNVGVDLVDMRALARQLERAGDRLSTRLFTANERAYCGGDIDRLATTLAGKEAVAKALETGIRGGVRWTDIEIRRKATGVPYVALDGAAAAAARGRHVDRVALSLCHEPPVAVAVAIAIGGVRAE